MTTAQPLKIAPLNTKEAFERIGDLPLFQEISHTFAQSLVGNLTSIKNAMKAQQWHDAMRMAHSLKGTLAIVGAEDLREIATLLEYSCRDEKAEEAEKNLAILKQTKEQLIEALNKI